MGRSTGNRLPVITGLVVALILAGFVLPGGGPEGSAANLEQTREAARAFYYRHPEVRLSPRDRSLLGNEHVEIAEVGRATRADAARQPPRLRARFQRQFDALTAAADGARRATSAAWRYGVDAGDRVNRNFLGYGFFHEEVIVVAISLIFFLIAGIGIEGAWGSVVFALFCAVALFVPAFAHASLAPPGGVPLSGASGLLAALLVAYWLRGAGGRFVLPGWVLLPIWLFAEYVIVRSVWLDRVEGLPLYAHGAGFVIGGLAAAVMGWLGGERRLAERSEGSAAASHPALAIAARAAEDQQFDAAWSALANAWAASPDDDEVALAWWKLACDQDRAGEAVPAIVPRIRQQMREGSVDTALEHWFDIVRHAPEAELEAQLTTRLAEALIERGETAGARDALRRAVDDPQGLPTALAQRIVRSARELEPELARKAALMALEDAQLDPDSREALEALVAGTGPVSAPLATDADQPDAEPAGGEGILDLGEPMAPASEPEEADPEPGAWEPEELGDGSAADEDELEEDEPVPELGLADDEELGAPDEIELEPGPGSGGSLLSEIDPATLTIPSAEAEAEGEGEAIGEEAGGDEDDEEPVLEVSAELLVDDEPEPVGALRSAKVIEGVPVGLGEDALEVEIRGRGLGRIPYSRIEALAVAAVSGLSARPVLVIDLVLNWSSPADEPVKLIRMQGNLFDPLTLSPDAPSPVQALKDVIARLIDRSGAECLPNAAAVGGNPFRRFDGLAEYEHEVLGVGV